MSINSVLTVFKLSLLLTIYTPLRKQAEVLLSAVDTFEMLGQYLCHQHT